MKSLIKFLNDEIVINKKLIVRLKRYRLIWVNRNPNRIEFLSHPHIGVVPIRFLPTEEEEFFNDVLGLDKGYAEKQIHTLKDINKDWGVGGNVFYLTCVGLMAVIIADTNINQKYTDDAVNSLYLLISYRLLTSMTVQGFKYDLPLNLAEQVYERMSKRFIIKKTGSWDELLKYRFKDFSPKGIYYERLKRPNNEDVVKVVAAIRTRIADHFQEQYDVIDQVMADEEKRLNSSLVKSSDEGEYIVDMENLNREYFSYAKTIVPIKSEFMDRDIMQVITDVFNRINEKEFKHVLEEISDRYLDDKNIDKIVSAVLKANIEYIYGTKLYPPYDKRILKVLLHCKGLWTSSRVKNDDVLFVKEHLKVLIIDITGKHTEWLVTPLVTAVAMYIFLKTVIGYKR